MNGAAYHKIKKWQLADADPLACTCSKLSEQVEVEQYFVESGLIIPSFHKFYWLGLRTELWPNFTWVDRSAGPDAGTYEHWGRYISLGNEPEPNNYDAPPEYCGGANWTESFGNPSAWGWADYNCDQPFVSMCKLSSELQWLASAAGAAVHCRSLLHVPLSCSLILACAAAQPSMLNAHAGFSFAEPLVATCELMALPSRYVLNTSAATFDEAQASCQSHGGHLAAYNDQAEQVSPALCIAARDAAGCRCRQP